MFWLAKFNGSTLYQHDSQGREVQFRKVIDRSKDLKSLSIVVTKDRVYTVSLEDSHFSLFIHGTIVNFFAHDINPKSLKNIRVIYFKREQVDFNVGSLKQTGSSKTLFTALGFQCNIDGKNFKRILHIYANGEFTMADR